MSYPSYDLDDYATKSLANEILRRTSENKKGLCWYCGRKLSTGKPCRKNRVHDGTEV